MHQLGRADARRGKRRRPGISERASRWPDRLRSGADDGQRAAGGGGGGGVTGRSWLPPQASGFLQHHCPSLPEKTGPTPAVGSVEPPYPCVGSGSGGLLADHLHAASAVTLSPRAARNLHQCVYIVNLSCCFSVQLAPLRRRRSRGGAGGRRPEGAERGSSGDAREMIQGDEDSGSIGAVNDRAPHPCSVYGFCGEHWSEYPWIPAFAGNDINGIVAVIPAKAGMIVPHGADRNAAIGHSREGGNPYGLSEHECG